MESDVLWRSSSIIFIKPTDVTEEERRAGEEEVGGVELYLVFV